MKRLFLTVAFVCIAIFGAFASEKITAPMVPDEQDSVSPTKITELQEVVVKSGGRRYTKKGNPAVALMQRIRKEYPKHDPRCENEYSFNEYEKLSLGIHDFKSTGESDLAEFIDTASTTGKPVLNLSLKENARARIFSENGKREKSVVIGRRSEGIDESLDRGNIQRLLSDVLRQVDIFGNDITIMQNRFVSPLSAIAADYYKFYLTDTISEGGKRYIRLVFGPHNRESMGFSGSLYVEEGDSSMFIKRIDMRVPKSINLNYVKDLRIRQEYEKDFMGNRHKILDEMSVVLQVVAGTPEIYARRDTRASGHSYLISDLYRPYIYMEGEEHTLPDADSKSEIDWALLRIGEMSMAQRSMHNLMPRLRSNKIFYWGEKIVSCLVKGYISPVKESPVTLGPLNTLASWNDVEGMRLRVGGMTTAYLSKRLFARGYIAYGIKDRRFKYSAELEYSFLDKEYHSREFPIHSLRLTHTYDLDRIGQHYLFTNPDNIFLSPKRMTNRKMTYRRSTNLIYTLEKRSGFSFEIEAKLERQQASRWIDFRFSDGTVKNHYNQNSLLVRFRYAPGETFYQSASQRLPINMDAPVFMLTHEFGPKGFFGSDFTINKTEISFQKRFWFSAFGYLDAIVRGAKIWSKVYYPALTWANANLSYTIQPESFSLMQPMEFATDQYLSWDLTYWLNGLILNRIPIVKKAKLREVVSFKGYWGSLSDKNNPKKNRDIPLFPADANVRTMGSKPYMELSVGLDNIFTILRIDWVWRLTYRESLPWKDKYGIRIALHFSF